MVLVHACSEQEIPVWRARWKGCGRSEAKAGNEAEQGLKARHKFLGDVYGPAKAVPLLQSFLSFVLSSLQDGHFIEEFLSLL